MKISALRILASTICLLISSIITISCDERMNSEIPYDNDSDDNITTPNIVDVAIKNMIKKIHSDVGGLDRWESDYLITDKKYKHRVLFTDKLDPKLGFNKIVEIVIIYDYSNDNNSLEILSNAASVMSTSIGLSGMFDANSNGFNLVDQNLNPIDRDKYENYYLQSITLDYSVPSLDGDNIIDGNNRRLLEELYMVEPNLADSKLSLLRVKTEGKDPINNIDYIILNDILVAPIRYQYRKGE